MSAYNRSYLSNINPQLLTIVFFIAALLLGPGLLGCFYSEDLGKTYDKVYTALLFGLVGYFFTAPIWKGDRCWFWTMGAYRKSFQKNVLIAMLFSCFLIPFVALYLICYGLALLVIWISENGFADKNKGSEMFSYCSNDEVVFNNIKKGAIEMTENTKGHIEKHQNVLVSDKKLEKELSNYPLSQIKKYRTAIYCELEGIEERLNPNGPYLAIKSPEVKIDFCYLYFQKNGICLDLRLPNQRQSEIEKAGFEVRPRDNWQRKSNWVTGIRIPYDNSYINKAAALIKKAYCFRFEKL